MPLIKIKTLENIKPTITTSHTEESSPKARFRKIVQKLQTEKKSISEAVGAVIQKDPIEGKINSLVIQSQNLEKEFKTIFQLFNRMGEQIYVDFAKQSDNGDLEKKERSKSTSDVNENNERKNSLEQKPGLVAGVNPLQNKELISKSISPMRRGQSFNEKKIGSSIGRLLKMAKEG